MQRCLELAAKGTGSVSPNPLVGCVIVHSGNIIGEGRHQKYGGSHAEVNAIASVKNKTLLSEACLYVNLEPCSHFGKTPPCTDLIIHHKIPKVVIGALDTNVKVAGKGIHTLRESGCDTKIGVLEEECRFLNRRFYTFHEKNRPYIILKWAETLDGFIDMERSASGDDRPGWITNELCRKLVHKWRSEESAILVGTNTALMDNPQLIVREWSGKNPLRIVLDRTLRLPSNLHLFDQSIPTIVFTEKPKPSTLNIDYVQIAFDEFLIEQLLEHLHQKGVQSLIVEGGAQLLSSFISKNLWDEARVFTGNQHFTIGVVAPNFSFTPVSETKIEESSLRLYTNTAFHLTS